MKEGEGAGGIGMFGVCMDAFYGYCYFKNLFI